MEELRFNETGAEFIVDTDAKAAWAVSRIAEKREKAEEFVEWYEQKIKEIKEEVEQDCAFLSASLERYFDSVPHKSTKTTESYTFPGGKLTRKKQQTEYKRDDKTIIDWLKSNADGQFVKTTESLDWAGLKAATGVFEGQIVTGDGEIVPGIEVIERPDKFVVEVLPKKKGA